MVAVVARFLAQSKSLSSLVKPVLASVRRLATGAMFKVRKSLAVSLPGETSSRNPFFEH
jgi:hypothetical protein